MLVRLAWRNLWRNTKRTVILTASVFFAVVLSLAMRSMQHGQYDMMINLAVSMYTGAVQVQGTGYWEKRTLEKSITVSPEEMAWIASRPHVGKMATRLETGMLVAHGAATKVGPVIGIDPEAEQAMTGLRKRLVRGAWPAAADSGVLLAQGLAKALGVDVGDSVVLYGQGWRDVTAAAQARVLGIVSFPVPEADNSMVYAPIGYVQWLTSAPDRITGVAMLVDDAREVDNVAADLRSRFSGNRTVMTWAEMQPELVSGIAADSASGVVLIIVLYIIIGFGVLGTIMMMTSERRREFGMLVAPHTRGRYDIGVHHDRPPWSVLGYWVQRSSVVVPVAPPHSADGRIGKRNDGVQHRAVPSLQQCPRDILDARNHRPRHRLRMRALPDSLDPQAGTGKGNAMRRRGPIRILVASYGIASHRDRNAWCSCGSGGDRSIAKFIRTPTLTSQIFIFQF
jgi:ABC-type lipoprotein release transport system permease subunit